MRRELVIGTLLTSVSAAASQSMSVAVCNLGHLPVIAIAQAEEEVRYVFSTIGIQVRWLDCQESADSRHIDPRFTIRLRRDGQFVQAEPAALAWMGRAFVSADSTGSLADAYYDSIREFAVAHPIADTGQVLGYVIAHELGHLLLGPGHAPSGIMRAAWNTTQMRALRERGLRFTKAEQSAIRSQLRRLGYPPAWP